MKQGTVEHYIHSELMDLWRLARHEKDTHIEVAMAALWHKRMVILARAIVALEELEGD